MFGSVVAVAFQITFRAEIHANDVFLFLKKIIFDISTSKRSKKYKPHLILTKKNLNFLGMPVEPRSQTANKADSNNPIQVFFLIEIFITRFKLVFKQVKLVFKLFNLLDQTLLILITLILFLFALDPSLTIISILKK